MKKYIIVCSLLFVVNSAVAEQIQYDVYQGFPDQRTGSVRINGERYNVTERTSPWGGTEMEVKNYNNTYRGSIDTFGYGTLKDYNGNSIKVKPY